MITKEEQAKSRVQVKTRVQRIMSEVSVAYIAQSTLALLDAFEKMEAKLHKTEVECDYWKQTAHVMKAHIKVIGQELRRRTVMCDTCSSALCEDCKRHLAGNDCERWKFDESWFTKENDGE